jgi:3-hydroxyacyl-CoA dehydrogenase / 3-hydroxy-2-methylbutyryl-CoA dehydrogenase
MNVDRADGKAVRPGKPDEFAALVRHGIENVMLNGVVLRLDGGMRMPSKM